jgi:hypothetical protein
VSDAGDLSYETTVSDAGATLVNNKTMKDRYENAT